VTASGMGLERHGGHPEVMEGVASLSHPAPQSQLNRSVHHGPDGLKERAR
jgi:hypothetical protein